MNGLNSALSGRSRRVSSNDHLNTKLPNHSACSTAILDDSSVLNILAYLNLNKQVELRIVSRQFERLVDRSISNINKLIICDRMPPSNGVLKYTEECYTAEDCVYVTNFNKFFNRYAGKLVDLQTLVIIGLKRDVYQLSVELSNLRHLELYNCTISNCQLLQSPKLENFYNENVVFKNKLKFQVNKLANLSISSKYFVNLCLPINELIYLEIPEIFGHLSLDKYINLKVRRIKIKTKCIPTAIDLVKKFDCIERVDLIVREIGLCCLFGIEKRYLKAFLKQKRDKLDLFIFGIKITWQTVDAFNKFLENIMNLLQIENDKMGLVIEGSTDDCIEAFKELEDNDKLVHNFYGLIDFLTFDDLIISNMTFNKFVNVKSIVMNLNDPNYHANDEFNVFFSYFAELKHLQIRSTSKVQLRNRFLDTIPTYCKKLNHLYLECWDDVWSAGFISQLRCLKYLIVASYQPIKNRPFSRLIKQLNHLAYLRFSFLKPENGFVNQDLSKSVE